MVDIMNSDADPRALQQAQNAETQRKQRADGVRVEEENDRRCTRLIMLGVLERESAQQAVARVEPSVREHLSAQQAATQDDGTRKEEENNLRRARVWKLV